jgi:hypothetical protein
MLIASSPSIARAGVDADTAVNSPDEFSWDIFVQIDAAAGHGNDVLWETWCQDTDTFPQHPNTAAPPQWATCVSQPKILTPDRQVRFNQAQFAEMTGIKPSIAPSGENQEVRRNKPTFDFIVSKGLWYTEELETSLTLVRLSRFQMTR